MQFEKQCMDWGKEFLDGLKLPISYSNSAAAAAMFHEYVLNRALREIDLSDKKSIEHHKLLIDKLGRDILLSQLEEVPMHGIVVLGEGEKDDSHAFLYGERIGGLKHDIDLQFDIVIDQVEGTSRIIKGENGVFKGTMCVQLYAQRNSILPVPGTYGLQVAVSSRAKGALDISKPIEENAKNIAQAYGCKISALRFAFINRDRSQKDISTLLGLGVPDENITRYKAGSIEQTMRLAYESCNKNDNNLVLWSVNGTPEGIISAAIVKFLRGDFAMMINPEYEKDPKRIEVINLQAQERGVDISKGKIYRLDEILKGDCAVFATGITDPACLIYSKQDITGKDTAVVNGLPGVVFKNGKLYAHTRMFLSTGSRREFAKENYIFEPHLQMRFGL